MPQQLGDDSVEVKHYGWILRRRWWVVVLGGLLGSILATAYIVTAPDSATATAVVQVNVISAEPFASGKPDSQLIDAATEAQLAKSSHVLAMVASELGQDQTLADIRRSTTVVPVASATVVKITFTSSSRSEAVQGADDIASAYLNYRSDIASQKVGQVVSNLQARVSELHKKLDAANNEYRVAVTGSQQSLEANSQRQLVSTQLDAILAQIDSLNGIDTSGGDLISDAADNGVILNPGKKVVLLSGGLLGLVLGVIGAFVVNARDDRVYDWRTARLSGGGDLLAELPTPRATFPAESADLDAFRSLRERLLGSAGPVLIVLDLMTGGRPSDVGVNLAAVFAETGRKTLLILPDHHPAFVERLSADLGLKADVGRPRLRSSVVVGLDVVVLERETPSTPSATLLARALAGNSPEFAATIVSVPSTSTMSLRLAAGRLGHSILLVANRKGTRVRTVRALADELSAVGAEVHGAVLVAGNRRMVPHAPAPPVASAEPEPDRVSPPDDPESEADTKSVETEAVGAKSAEAAAVETEPAIADAGEPDASAQPVGGASATAAGFGSPGTAPRNGPTRQKPRNRWPSPSMEKVPRKGK